MSSRKSKKQTSFGFPEYLVDTKNNLKYEKCDFIGKVSSNFFIIEELINCLTFVYTVIFRF